MAYPPLILTGTVSGLPAPSITYSTMATTSWSIPSMANLTLTGTTTSADLKVSGAIDAKELVLDGVNINKVLSSIQDRLAILIPDPAKLEKFAALKASYDHYLLMEKLCTDNPIDIL